NVNWPPHRLKAPEVWINGCLVSGDNNNCSEESSRQRRLSATSTESDAKRNLPLLQNVGRTLQRTHSQLRRTRLLHVFYLCALPAYTLLGALVFQALDAEHDRAWLKIYESRCREGREERLATLRRKCELVTGFNCFDEMRQMLIEVETCYRRWHETNRTITHPMSEFTNAIIYAFSVYTSIGYGTISAGSMAARIATVLYGALGIPLFFAFVKEEGNLFRRCFISLYSRFKQMRHVRRKRSWSFLNFWRRKTEKESKGAATVAILVEKSFKVNSAPTRAVFERQWSSASMVPG
ncbi:Ion transport 2, partial [Aphelenchoides avenae]